MKNWKDCLIYMVLIIMNIIFFNTTSNYIAIVVSWFMFMEIKRGD